MVGKEKNLLMSVRRLIPCVRRYKGVWINEANFSVAPVNIAEVVEVFMGCVFLLLVQ